MPTDAEKRDARLTASKIANAGVRIILRLWNS